MLHGLTQFLAQEAGQGTGAAAEATSSTPSPPPELVFYLFGSHSLPVTNTIFTAWIVIIILVVCAALGTRNMRMLPSGMQNFWEMIIELWVGVSENTMGPRRARRFMPLVA